MKVIFFTMILLPLLTSCNAGQKGTTNRIQVTPSEIARSPQGGAYIIDLTRDGRIYEVSPDIDYRRVKVRTSKTETPLSDVVARLQITGTKFVVGSANDLSLTNFDFPPGSGSGGGVSEMKCNGLICGCNSGTDCKDMKKKFPNQKFYCGYTPSDAKNTTDYGRTPGTYGCITEQPQ